MPDPPVIAPIRPPSPPVPSAAPAPPTAPRAASPIVATIDLVRELARKLRDGKRDEVLSTVKQLTPFELDALDALLIPALSQDKNKKHGFDLRRVIRFVRKNPTLPPKNPAFINSGGSPEPKAEAKVANGTVTMRTGVHLEGPGLTTSDDAYSLNYNGPDAADMRWLQFIWRRVVVEFPAAVKGGKSRQVALKMRLDHSGIPYLLTTDLTTNPSKPRWTTDSSVRRSAFYEENATVKRSTLELTMVDAPSPLPKITLADDLFNSTNPPTNFVAQFHAATFLVRGMDVLYRSEIDYTWAFTSTKVPKPTIKPSGGPAKELDSGQRAALAYQFPEFDYLPGPPIGPPLPKDEFDPIRDLALKDWDTKSDPERFADVAALAQADLILDVKGVSEKSINKAANESDVRSGLNFLAKLSAQGQTGYIDSARKYHNPDFPFDRFSELPQVAIILGGSAFKWGGKQTVREKPYTLATLRHEMLHAVHNEMAIGWLLKWRDELTDKDFRQWFSTEKISKVDRTLVLTGFAPFDLRPTELLAYTEGFVTALPFLPVKPLYSLMTTKETWPAAIIELKEAGERYVGLSGEVQTQTAARERIRRVVCNSMVQSQRDSLIAWIDFLLKPDSLNPTTTSEKETAKLVSAFFKGKEDFLKQVRDQAKLKCP